MSLKYIHFTEEQKKQARQTDLVEFLRSRGETLKRSGSEYQWKSGGEKITIRGNLWFHQYDREGGDAIDFVRRIYNMSYPEAVSLLLSENRISVPKFGEPVKIQKPFELPKANSNMRRVYAYLLKQRAIDPEVVNFFVHKKLLYEDAKHHNCVFVRIDENGIPRHAHKRGTFSGSSYKGNICGSLPEYSFHHIGSSNRIYVFEAPIDLLSFISMNKVGWQNHSYVALCCVGDKALQYQLKANLDISNIFLCLDNDKAGQEANMRIGKKLAEQNISYELLVPSQKDWNEELLFSKVMEETPCQELVL